MENKKHTEEYRRNIIAVAFVIFFAMLFASAFYNAGRENNFACEIID